MALCILLPQVVLFGPTCTRKVYQMQDMSMCCLTFFKSSSELQLLNSIFLSTGTVLLGVLRRRKTITYWYLSMLTLSHQHNDCRMRQMYLHLQGPDNQGSIPTNMHGSSFFFYALFSFLMLYLVFWCKYSYAYTYTFVHSFNLNGMHGWLHGQDHVMCCTAAYVTLWSNMGNLYKFFWSFSSSSYTCI